MAALALANYLTPVEVTEASYPVKAGVVIYPGAWLCLNAGYLAPVTAASGLTIKGVATTRVTIDNSASAVDGQDSTGRALLANVALGIGKSGRVAFPVDSAAAPNNIEQSDVGTNVYGLDDHTASTSATTKSIMGEVWKLDTDGRWLVFPPA